MPYTFETHEKDGYLLLIASGSIESLDDMKAVSQAIKDTAAQFRCRRFLIDERAVNKTIDPHDITIFAEFRANEPDYRLRVALVCTPENVSRLRWIETFFQNRSLPYRQFSSFQEAEQWLMSPSSLED